MKVHLLTKAFQNFQPHETSCANDESTEEYVEQTVDSLMYVPLSLAISILIQEAIWFLERFEISSLRS